MTRVKYPQQQSRHPSTPATFRGGGPIASSTRSYVGHAFKPSLLTTLSGPSAQPKHLAAPNERLIACFAPTKFINFAINTPGSSTNGEGHWGGGAKQQNAKRVCGQERRRSQLGTPRRVDVLQTHKKIVTQVEKSTRSVQFYSKRSNHTTFGALSYQDRTSTHYNVVLRLAAAKSVITKTINGKRSYLRLL